MYSFFHSILKDKKGGEIFELFSAWHFAYIFLALIAIIILLRVLKNEKHKQKAREILISCAFGLYIMDFFLMPLSYGEIDIEKLPFHACTAMCVMCFWSYHNKFLEKYRTSFAMLGFISNLVYLVYPAGVMWHAVHPISYRVIQTLIFHSLMTVYCLLELIYNREKIAFKTQLRDLGVIVAMTLWALLGNYVYNGTSGGYSHFFNWFFVVRDPFYAIDEQISVFVMPIINIVLFSVVEFVLHIILKFSNRQETR